MRIVNIDWDIDTEDIINTFHSKTVEEVAKAIDIPHDVAWVMTEEELTDYVLDACYQNRRVANEFVGLPNSVDINDSSIDAWCVARGEDWYSLPDIDKADAITDYLSDEYGYCLNNWEYEMLR